MYSIPDTTLLGVLKNPSGLWTLIYAPTSGMTIDTTASTYAPGCICVNTGSGLTYTNSGTTASPSWQNVNEINTAEIADSAVTPAKTRVSYDAAASAAGTGPTSVISDTATVVAASSAAADANSIIVLPTAVAGKEVIIITGATGMELRSPSTTTIAINGGTGSAAEVPLAATTAYRLTALSTTNWAATILGSTGQNLAAEAAAN